MRQFYMAYKDRENDVMVCMVVGKKIFIYVFGQHKFNRILSGTEVFHWQFSLRFCVSDK